MRGEGRTFHLTRDSRRSRFHAMVEDIDEGGFREVALSVHRGSRCIADVHITVDEVTREPIVYIRRQNPPSAGPRPSSKRS